MSESPHIVEVTRDNIAETVVQPSASVPVLVDFWAPWCGPCQTLLPMMEKLAGEYGGRFILAKVNIDEQPELAQHFGVRSVPTVKVVFDGQLVDEFMGALPESEVRAVIDRHVVGEAPAAAGAREQAAEALASGDTQRAVDLLVAAREENPDDHGATLDLAKIVAQLGEPEQAEALLKSLPASMADDPEVGGLRAGLAFAAAVKGAPEADELERMLAENPDDSKARYQLGARRAAAGDHEGALEAFLELMRRDRDFEEDAGRRAMFALFDLLGGQGPLVSTYRRKMFAALH